MVKAFAVEPIPAFPQQMPQLTTEPTINQKQYTDLLASAKRNGYSNAGFAKLIGKYGFTRGGEITQKSYPQLWAQACDRNQALLMKRKSSTPSGS